MCEPVLSLSVFVDKEVDGRRAKQKKEARWLSIRGGKKSLTSENRSNLRVQ